MRMMTMMMTICGQFKEHQINNDNSDNDDNEDDGDDDDNDDDNMQAIQRRLLEGREQGGQQLD